jgi:hypothetical protein
MEVPPIIVNDRTMVPMRAIFEALGMKVEWNGPFQLIFAGNDDLKCILMQIGKPIMARFTEGDIRQFVTDYVDHNLANMTAITLDSPPIIVEDRTLVPVRAVSEALGADVVWDAGARTVRITVDEAGLDKGYSEWDWVFDELER